MPSDTIPPDELDALLVRIAAEVRPLTAQGRVADYIPALARAPRERFGLSLRLADGREHAVGDADTPLSIQSVSKVFTLAFALDALGDALWSRVGREPSGMRFNSMVQLESENGVPRNPLVNAGALVTTDALIERHPEWATLFLERMRVLGAGPDAATSIGVDEEVAESERATGDLNRAIAWFLRAKRNLVNHPDSVTEAYFRACATAMTCRQLARAGRFLIGPRQLAESAPFELLRAVEQRKRVRAIMRTCGLYDAAGDFAYRVGLPAKSGVGGAILAISPGRYSVAVWSPALDAKGNSVAGVRALELLVDALEGRAFDRETAEATPHG